MEMANEATRGGCRSSGGDDWGFRVAHVEACLGWQDPEDQDRQKDRHPNFGTGTVPFRT